jgi:hypothetical protein
VRLVQYVLGVSREQALRVVGQGTFLPDDFLAAVHEKMGIGQPEEREAPSLRVPKEFKPLSDKLHSAAPFYRYMIEDRGFTRSQVNSMFDYHDLMYATRGRMRGRVIFPVYFQGKLQTWTGRAIDRDVELRYRTLSTDPELEVEPANGPINDFLLWYDDLMQYGGETLLLVEGPFDALKVTTLGRRFGIEGTCCFTAQPSASQMDYLYDVAPKFKRCFVLLDQGTLAASLKTTSAISQLGFKPLMLPASLKDPGELHHSRQLLDLLPT